MGNSDVCTESEEERGCETKQNKCVCPSKKQSGGVPKISQRYQIEYFKLKGGGKKDKKIKSSDDLEWTNQISRDKYDYLIDKIGQPNKICKNINGVVEYVVWQDPYDDVNEGRIGGLDFLKITNHHAKKWHPKPANVFIIAGKYLEVPDHLLGPIKYASETINVEQLFVEKEGNYEFGRTGQKSKVLVTGSCASVDISTVTVAFVEDMINEHKDNMEVDLALHEDFKAEYDRRINKYIEEGTYDEISWYDSSLFN